MQFLKENFKELTYPWWELVEKNKQGPEAPYISGFYQKEDGKIKILYGKRFFKSKRQTIAPRCEDKQVNLLACLFQKIQVNEILKTNFWKLLPNDLQERFNNGEILVTTSENLYDSGEEEVKKIKKLLTGNIKKYFVHYYSDAVASPLGIKYGRTGVLMVGTNGDIKPLLITINNKEYIVELKGCGMLSGGFGGFHKRSGGEVLTGGLDKEHALMEFETLSKLNKEDAPKVIGCILFENNSYKQGYIIRLSPSTVRASFTADDCYPDIEKEEVIKNVIKMHSIELTEQFFSPVPRIMRTSAHNENMLIWGSGKFIYTDFSDHSTFSNKNYPYYRADTGYLTLSRMLLIYLSMVDNIAGYKKERHQEYFYKILEEVFLTKEIKISLNNCQNPEDATKEIWQKCMAYEVFKAKKKDGYTPQGVLNELKNFITNDSKQFDLPLDSKEKFIQRFNDESKNISTILSEFKDKPQTTQKEKIENGLQELSNNNFANFFENLRTINEIFKQNRNLLKDNEQKIFAKAILYFSSLRHGLINTIKRYFEHEQDLISSAIISAPENEKILLNNALEEINKKINEINKTINKGPESIYLEFVDLEKVKKIVSLSFYEN